MAGQCASCLASARIRAVPFTAAFMDALWGPRSLYSKFHTPEQKGRVAANPKPVQPLTGSMKAVVTIPYERLAKEEEGAGTALLLESIAKAYGPHGLGILTVSGVPGYPEARARLLPLMQQLVGLADAVKKQLEDEESHFTVGWACGKETLQNGKRDARKASFYANPLDDNPTCSSPEQALLHPGYLRPNRWPTSSLPELEPAFKALAKVIINVGLLLMDHCDRYVASLNPHSQPGRLRSVLESSTMHKARLLHYSSADNSGDSAEASARDDVPASSDQQEQPWCAEHRDHGSLTGLTSAMYMLEGKEVACPDRDAGLIIRDRSGQEVKVAIPPDHIAFQVGESLQVHSGGLLQATPHYVRGPSAASASLGLSRNTFAVFLQPDLGEPMACPPGASDADVGVELWTRGMDFGLFAAAKLKKYYHQ